MRTTGGQQLFFFPQAFVETIICLTFTQMRVRFDIFLLVDKTAFGKMTSCRNVVLDFNIPYRMFFSP